MDLLAPYMGLLKLPQGLASIRLQQLSLLPGLPTQPLLLALQLTPGSLGPASTTLPSAVLPCKCEACLK